MKRLLLIICYMLPFIAAHAQKENSNWTFGNGRRFSFATVPPSLVGSSFKSIAGTMSYPCAVSDSAGNLLFYTDGNTAWNRLHTKMPNGQDIMTASVHPNCQGASTDKAVANVTIIQDPGNKNHYYIIGNTIGRSFDAVTGCTKVGEAKYCMVDMSLDGGLGDVIPATKNTYLYYNVNSNIATGNGRCNKWVIFSNPSGQFLAFEITASGINSSPVISSNGLGPYYYYSKISNDNSKIAVACTDILPNVWHLLLSDFDVNTGIVSNTRVVDTVHQSGGQIGGVAFSADNSKLYYFGPGTEITQFDLSLPTLQGIQASETRVFKINLNHGRHTSELMLGPDGKIYNAYYFAKWVTIHHPDKKGAACDVRIDSLPPAMSISLDNMYGFQNWVPASRVHYSYSDFNTCSFPATLASMQGSADNYEWSTGASTRDITVTQNGTYWVKASQSCGAYRVDTFHVNFNPPRPINDTFSCNGAPVTIPTDADATYSWGNGGGPVFAQSGTYTATISKPDCGTINSSFRVIIYPPAGTPILPDDTTICNTAGQAIIGCKYEMGQYLWSTGATTREINISQPGTYWLSCNTPCGLFTDTIKVKYCKPKIKNIYMPASACIGNCVDFYAEVDNYPQAFNWSLPAGATATPTDAKGQGIKVCFTDTSMKTVTLEVMSMGGNDLSAKTIKVLPPVKGRFDDTSLKAKYKTILLLPVCGDAERIDWYKEEELVCENCPTLEIEARLWRSNYTCIVQNADCRDTCNYQLEVTGIPTDVWLPTAFSPNGDGKNDLFRPLYDNPNVQIMALSVYNRQGVRMYRSTEDGPEGWNGRYHGTEQGIGTYFWSLQYKVLGNPNILSLKGDVTLLR